MGRVPLFHAVTHGMRVTVRPQYLDDHSRPSAREYVFAYHVRIENVGAETVQLVRRHWFIHDSIGEDTEVEGDGVVGLQPIIAPGSVHEYQSYCVLKSVSGHMEGEYHFARPDGTELRAAIPRFVLSAAASANPH
jgi:ApaG protein